ncbi:MAG: GNAT family N-acetyltransferase [Magnetospiraceae bacterium]
MGSTPENRLELRLARREEEILASQRLRYEIFFGEYGAKASPDIAAAKLDMDSFDTYCDHLLVIDKSRADETVPVVGSYRMLRRSVADEHDGFYSATEFDLANLKNYPGEIVEMGRSCVHADYRNAAVMQLLWRGIAEYLQHYNIGLMFGCASFPGIDPANVAQALSYLNHHLAAPESWRPQALPDRFVPMDRVAPDQIETKTALREMPPLVKGYLRLGAKVGHGAVIDPDFNTVDVCILVESETVDHRYQRHYLDQEPVVRQMVQ